MSDSYGTEVHKRDQYLSVNLNLTADNFAVQRDVPRLHELTAHELRTGIDKLLLQMAENNAASHREIGRLFALLVDES